MTNLLVRIFVKEYDKTGKPAVRGRYGLLAGFVGLACNVLLFSLKFLVGVIFGSIAIIGGCGQQPFRCRVLYCDAHWI